MSEDFIIGSFRQTKVKEQDSLSWKQESRIQSNDKFSEVLVRYIESSDPLEKEDEKLKDTKQAFEEANHSYGAMMNIKNDLKQAYERVIHLRTKE